MMTDIHPKLPMRRPETTRAYYVDLLGFEVLGDYGDYLMLKRDGVEIHFFAFPGLDPLQNYGQVYIRSNDIRGLYAECKARGVAIHPNAPLEAKPWGQLEFSLLDPDHNLLTFGQGQA